MHIPGRIYIGTCLGIVLLTAYLPADEPRQPTPQELLTGMGYEVTHDGMTRALKSGDPWAQIYSLMILRETNDQALLGIAQPLLGSSDIKVQLETAKMLSQFDRIEGIEWLQKWEHVVIDWSSPSTDTADAVLDAASALALRGDERLRTHIAPLLRHRFWTVRIHAVRALGDFRDTDDPEMEAVWLTAVDVVPEALADSTVREDFVELYLIWLLDSLFRQVNVTPAMTEKIVDLAESEHPLVCRTISAKISEFENAAKGQNHEH